MWDCSFFCSVPANSPTRSIFRQLIEQTGWSVTETQQDVCPVIELPKSWEEYLQQIGKKQRHEIKRKWSKLFRETNAEFEVVESAAEIKHSIDDFIALHQKSSEEKKNFWDDNHIQFFRRFAIETAEKGWLKLYFLKMNGKRVAAMLGFEYQQQFFLYNSGFDVAEYKSYGVGYVLTAHTIQQSIERGNTRYDFLRGGEEYKYRFGAVAEPIYDLKIVKST